jgi:D-aminopeptidase
LDLHLSFSIGNADSVAATNVAVTPNDSLNPIFEGVVQATEEAILNAMFAAETMTGVQGRQVRALPHDRVKDVPTCPLTVSMKHRATLADLA